MNKREFVFGNMLRERRKALNLSQKELAERMGYKNLSRGIRKINAIEDGEIIPEVLKKMMTCLGVTEKARQRCQKKEAAYIQEMIKKFPPFKPVLICRYMACVYSEIRIPENINSESEMLEFAKDFAKKHKRLCWLKLDYDYCYHINCEGKTAGPDRSFSPLPYAYIS